MLFDLLMDRLGARAEQCAYAQDHILFRRGDETHHIFGVLKGEARLLRYSSEGRQIVIHRAKTKTLFAEAALSSPTYHCDGLALGGTQIVKFPKELVLSRQRQDGDFAITISHHLVGQMQALRSALELRSIRCAEDRIMAALSLRLADGQKHHELTGTWKDFAQDIGLTHEALYRALKRLENGGRLRRDGVRVQLA